MHMALRAAACSLACLATTAAAAPAGPAPAAAPPTTSQQPHLLFLDRHHIESADPRLALRVQQPARGPWVLTPTEPWEGWAIAGYNTVIAGNGTRPHRIYYGILSPDS
eukprot:SAG11_NODE_3516_length_2397_cov_1.429504_1_plen_108_part_00